VRKAGGRSLTPDDWAAAALEVIARGGVDAVAVESIAADLGATKGSFYWHFKNRDALIDAALELWGRRRTEGTIDKLEQETDPAKRLRMLLTAAFELGPSDRAEITLLANPEHPAAVRAVRQQADRRISYMARQFELLGCDSRDALDRAAVAYYIYVGYMQTAHVAPKSIGGAALRRQARLVMQMLEPPASDPRAPAPRVRSGSVRRS
jgi:AcrR family transcriptional regulator